jgi:hypothetical protein
VKLSAKKLEKLMDISPALAELNRERFQQMSFPTTPANGKQAALAFAGDTYAGLDAPTLSPDDLAWAQSHLAILSGFYGLLRPLDLIQPYRLEMGTALPTRRGKNLYAFWGKRLAARANELTAGHPDRRVVNCASVEYWRAHPPRAAQRRRDHARLQGAERRGRQGHQLLRQARPGRDGAVAHPAARRGARGDQGLRRGRLPLPAGPVHGHRVGVYATGAPRVTEARRASV